MKEKAALKRPWRRENRIESEEGNEESEEWLFGRKSKKKKKKKEGLHLQPLSPRGDLKVKGGREVRSVDPETGNATLGSQGDLAVVGDRGGDSCQVVQVAHCHCHLSGGGQGGEAGWSL